MKELGTIHLQMKHGVGRYGMPLDDVSVEVKKRMQAEPHEWRLVHTVSAANLSWLLRGLWERLDPSIRALNLIFCS